MSHSDKASNYGREMAEIRHILSYAGKYPLLTKDQEYSLIGGYQTASRALGYAYAAGDPVLLRALLSWKKRCSDTMVNCNLRLIIKHAKALKDRGIPIAELVAEGVDGVIYACGLFKLELGYKFSTYATLWIRQRMFKAIDHKSRMLKLPPAIQGKITKLKKIYYHWCSKYGRDPTSEQLSEEFMRVYQLDVTPQECMELGMLDYDIQSLDKNVGDDDSITVGCLVPSPEVEDDLQGVRVLQEELLPAMPSEDRSFLQMKYSTTRVRSDREMSNLLSLPVKDIKAWTTRAIGTAQDTGFHGRLEDEGFQRTVKLHSLGPRAAQVERVWLRITGTPAVQGAEWTGAHELAEELAAEVEVADGYCSFA